MRRSRLPAGSVALALPLLALPLAVAAPAAAQAVPATPAALVAGDRAIRVAADSAALTVTFTGGGTARLDATTPAGSFVLATDSVTLRAWAVAATQLAAPGRDGAGEPLYRGVGLTDPGTGTSAALVRLTATAEGDYQLSLSEGGRRQVLRLRYPQWEALYLALLGEDAAALRSELGTLFYEFQVTTPVRAVRGNRAPAYPEALLATHARGEVVAQWAVDTQGRPRMETFKVISTSGAEFSNAVRDAVAGWRFTPAELEGRPVVQIVQQRFQFERR